MKRLLIAPLMVIALGLGVFSLSAETIAVPAAHADAVDCAVTVGGYGLGVIGAFVPPTWLGFSAYIVGTIGLNQAAKNRTCAGSSYYDHVGYQKVCLNSHFMFWTDSGQAVFDATAAICDHQPITDDVFYCLYLNHAYTDDVAACQSTVRWYYWYGGWSTIMR